MAGSPLRRAALIHNPTAGGGRRRAALAAAVEVLEAGGWRVDQRPTRHRGHASELARAAAAEGLETVIAAGGDGTVHEVVQGLAGSRTALGLLPAGTANVLAAQLGLVGWPSPLHRVDLPHAARALLDSRERRVDLGLARPRSGPSRYFLLWAGIGLDAAVTRAMETEGRRLKRALGPAAFGLVGLRELLAARPSPSQLRIDGRRDRGPLLMALVSNVRLYGGAFELAPEARLDDGRLDATIFFSDGRRATLRHLGGLLSGRPGSRQRVDRSLERIRVVAARPLPVHLDAEPFGTTPLTIEVRPAALRLLIPPGAPTEVFAQPAAEPDHASF